MSNKVVLNEIVAADSYFLELSNTLTRVPLTAVDEIADVLLEAYQRRSSVFIFGNGGSAALASHLACDLCKGTITNGLDRFRVLALTDNVPLMTAWANDSSYEDVFAEQIRNFLQPNDVAFAISGSGNSPNVLKGLSTARKLGAFNVGLTGFSGGRMLELCDHSLVVPSSDMQIIEDLHLSISHCIFRIICSRLFHSVAAT